MTIDNILPGSFVYTRSTGIGIVASRKNGTLVVIANDHDRWVEDHVTQVRLHQFTDLNPTGDPKINWQIHTAIRDKRHIKQGKPIGKTPPSYWFPRMLDGDFQKLHPNQELINQITAMLYHVTRAVADIDYPNLACVLLDHLRVRHDVRSEVLSHVLYCDYQRAQEIQLDCHKKPQAFSRVRSEFVKWYATVEQPAVMPL